MTVAEPQPNGQEGRCDHRELCELDTEVEAQQCRQDLVVRQMQLVQHAGEAHPVQQTEAEHKHGPPRCQRRRGDVLDADIGDRERDQRLDDPEGSEKTPYSESPSVTEWAMVKAVTWTRIGRNLD